MAVGIHSIHLGLDQVQFLQGEGVLVVDGGAPGKLDKFRQAIDGLLIDPREVQLIAVTHGHWDHIGSTRDLKELTGAKIVMHEQDKDLLEQPLRFDPGLPIFAEDMEKVKQSCLLLLELGAKTIYPAHRKPFAADLLRTAVA